MFMMFTSIWSLYYRHRNICTLIIEQFLFLIESEYLKGVPEKLGGALGLKVEKVCSKSLGKISLAVKLDFL